MSSFRSPFAIKHRSRAIAAVGKYTDVSMKTHIQRKKGKETMMLSGSLM